MISNKSLRLAFACAAISPLAVIPVSATNFRILDGYAETSFYATDDDTAGPVSFGFVANLFGTSYSELYINNNGNVTFDFASGLGNPSSIAGGLFEHGNAVLAPFFADVDTTYSQPVSYGVGAIAGRAAFVVNWSLVPAYGDAVSTLANSFQLFMVERPELGSEAFSFEFNFDQVQWDEGANSFGVSALSGYADGNSQSFLLPGSGLSGSLLDGGPANTSIILNQLGDPFDGAKRNGRYAFDVVNGAIRFHAPTPDPGPSPVPDTGSFASIGALLCAALLIASRHRR